MTRHSLAVKLCVKCRYCVDCTDYDPRLNSHGRLKVEPMLKCAHPQAPDRVTGRMPLCSEVRKSYKMCRHDGKWFKKVAAFKPNTVKDDGLEPYLWFAGFAIVAVGLFLWFLHCAGHLSSP